MIELDDDKLTESAIAQLEFLTKSHEYFVEREKTEEEREIFLIGLNRYIKLWLPFLIENQDMDDLVIPIDIAWMWHIHKLHPVPYLEHIEKITKDVDLRMPDIESYYAINKELSPVVMRNIETLLRLAIFEYTGKAFNIVKTIEEAEGSCTFKLWNEMYPNDSFVYDKEKISITIEEPDAIGLGNVNIMGSAHGQRHFYYQVSTDIFQQRSTLKAGAFDYRKFLNVALMFEYSICVPRYDIDLLWHTHMTTSPLSYVIDTLDVMGYVVNHDDSETDKGPDSILIRGFKETADNWFQLYGEFYKKEGLAEYRGQPSKEFYTQEWIDEFRSKAVFTLVE